MTRLAPTDRAELLPLQALVRALVARRRDEAAALLAEHPLSAGDAAWLQTQAMAPFVFYSLRQAGLLDAVEAQAQITLKQAYYASAAQHSLLESELRRLLEQLEQRDIRPIVLKGMALASTLYARREIRPTSDIDLLIRPAEVDETQRVLLANGYHVSGMDALHRQFNNQILVWREVTPGQRIIVEPHWHLFDTPEALTSVDLEPFFQRSLRADLGMRIANTLDPYDTLLHSAAHLFKHALARSVQLLWLLDIHLLVERAAAGWDWPLLVSRAGELQLGAALRYALDSARAAFGTMIPPEAAAALDALPLAPQEQQALDALREAPARMWRRHTQITSHLPDRRSRLLYVWGILFPSWEYMQQRYHVRWRWLAPAVYLYRLVRAVPFAFRRVGAA